MTYAWYDRNEGTNVVSNSVNFLKREMTTNGRLVNLFFQLCRIDGQKKRKVFRNALNWRKEKIL